MSEISALEEATKPRQGNKPSYDEAYVILALNIIYDESPVGRITLMRKLGLGEASMKTMLRRLKEMGLIAVDKVGGNQLTDKGKELIEAWRSRVSIRPAALESLKWKCNQIALKNGEGLVDRFGVIRLRDEIIRMGAEASLITVKRNGLEIPPRTDEFSINSLLQEVTFLSNQFDRGTLIIYITPQDIHLAYKVATRLLQFESGISG
ncbi:MAG: DUF4443 domain-containing protein [Metallosphaera sp.]